MNSDNNLPMKFIIYSEGHSDDKVAKTKLHKLKPFSLITRITIH